MVSNKHWNELAYVTDVKASSGITVSKWCCFFRYTTSFETECLDLLRLWYRASEIEVFWAVL